MKKLVLFLMMSASFAAADLPTVGFDCEVSDASEQNTWGTWNVFQEEARYFQVNYTQNGSALSLTNAGITNVYLSLKASNSTNRYLLAGSVYSATGGSVRVLMSSTNVYPVALYNAEFQVPDVLEVNKAAWGKINVKKGTSGGTTTNAPYLPTPVTKIIAGTGITVSPSAGVGDVTVSSSAGGGTVTNVSAGTNIVISGDSTVNPTVNLDPAVYASINANSSTGATHTTQISALVDTQAVVKATANGALQTSGGTMSGNLNMGGNDITNGGTVVVASVGATEAATYLTLNAQPTYEASDCAILVQTNQIVNVLGNVGEPAFVVGTTAETYIDVKDKVFSQYEATTNYYGKQWYSASNRWAEVYVKGGVTSVVFTSPEM